MHKQLETVGGWIPEEFRHGDTCLRLMETQLVFKMMRLAMISGVTVDRKEEKAGAVGPV